MKYHQHLLLVKCVHEIGHILTPLFMEQLNTTKIKKVFPMPTWLGSVKRGRRRECYGLEEILCGGRLFHERPIYGPAFYIEDLSVEKMVDGKWKRYLIKDSFIRRSRKRLVSFQVRNEELIDINSKKSIYKRMAPEFSYRKV